VILSRNVARLRAEHDALEADFSALLADQRAVRAELAYIRETLLPGIVSEHDDAIAALQRVLNSRTEHRV
jgi:hypothetical protein